MNKEKMEKNFFNQSYFMIKKVVNNSVKSLYYSNIYKSVGLDLQDDFSYEDFIKIPITDKDTYRTNKLFMMTSQLFDIEHYYNLENDLSKKREYLAANGVQLKITSGSTGIPLEVIKSQKDNDRDYFLLNYYRNKLTNYRFKGKFLWIWPVNPVTRKYFYASDRGDYLIKINDHGSQYMLYRYSDENFENLYNILKKGNYEWITSSPSVLANFSSYLLKRNVCIDGVKYIECHSEYLYKWQEDLIVQIFHTKPVSIYSSNEVQFIGVKCGYSDNYHIFSSNCFLEFIELNGNYEAVVTSLNYYDFPMIRYKLGDCGEWVKNSICTCDIKELPMFSLKKFRINDFIVGRNGNRIEPNIITDSLILLKSVYNLKINQYKVLQADFDLFIYYLPLEVCENVQLESIQVYLEKYLSKLLLTKIRVIVKKVDISIEFSECDKFKYFMVDAKLL